MTSTAPRTSDERPTPLLAVLERLRDSSGFPTLSSTICDINRAVASDLHSAQQLTQVILRDASLTTKLLQVVNSAVYGQYRGRIRTVSKAVMILGFEVVRNVAMSLMILEFSRGRPQERTLQDELVGAFFASVMAKPLCQRLTMCNSEEAVICTIFQSLGRLLVTFFLFEESRQIRALMENGTAEEQAAEQVLGISYRELGVGVARQWGLPERLVEGMQRLALRDITPPKTEAEKLKIVANLANDLYITALRCPETGKRAALDALSKRYSAAIKIDATELLATIDRGLKEISEGATTLNLPVAQSSALNTIRMWTGGVPDSVEAESADDAAGADPLMVGVDALNALENSTSDAVDPYQVLSAGIRDVTETLTGEFALNDVLQMVLETMYRGMGFTRTLIFIRDTQLSTMRARFGFGAGTERIIAKCSFPLAFAPDVFHVALQKGVDISIENAQAAKIVDRIPLWHREAINASSFLLLPIMMKQHAIGLLYADYERPDAMKIDAELLGLMRTLRSQVVLAFKHSVASNR
jgi:HD-like signal output (HDOD) protein